MSFAYKISKAERVVRVTGDGQCALDQLMVIIREVAAHAEWSPEYSVLVDLSCMNSVPDVWQVTAITGFVGDLRSCFQGPIALTARAPLQRGSAEMAAIQLETRGFRAAAFNDLAEAAAWLGVAMPPNGPAQTRPGASPPR